MVPKVWSENPWGPPNPLRASLWSHLFQLHKQVQILSSPKITCHSRLHADADMRIQLFSIEPDIKEIRKMLNSATLLTKCF